MKEKKKNSNNSAFYIALCCCVGVIGLIGYITNQGRTKMVNQPILEEKTVLKKTEDEKPKDSESDVITKTGQEPLPTLSPVIEKPNDSIPVSTSVSHEYTEPDINNEDVDVLERDEPAEFYDGETVPSVSINPDPEFIMPVNGEICEKFSGSKLIYNKALDDYRTHNGIDIKAKAGSDVLVAADGVIEEVYTDYIGNTVIISHDNGYKTKYSCLENIDNLTAGVKVTRGSFLSAVSSKTKGENLTEPHLHFELIKNEEFVNPEDYIE